MPCPSLRVIEGFFFLGVKKFEKFCINILKSNNYYVTLVHQLKQ